MISLFRTFIGFFLLLNSSLLFSQNSPVAISDYYTSTSSFQLKGKVKSCHTKEFALANNSEILSKISSDVEKLSFLPNGFIDENTSYLNGSLFKKAKYNRISPSYIEVENQHALGKVATFDALILDSAGRVKEHYEDFLKEGSGFKNNSFYVKKCFLNQRLYNNNYSKPDSVITFENKKTFHSKSIYKYTPDKLPVEELLFLNEPIGNKKIMYLYDKDQRMIEARTTYTHQDNKQSEMSKYSYNPKGNLETEVNTYYSDADFNSLDNTVIYKYKYEYDNQGNWIKATKYEGDKIESITVRTIVYY
jgi:hypothetical protein